MTSFQNLLGVQQTIFNNGRDIMDTNKIFLLSLEPGKVLALNNDKEIVTSDIQTEVDNIVIDLNDKYDKVGGTISGDCFITGDLTVGSDKFIVDSTNNIIKSKLSNGFYITSNPDVSLPVPNIATSGNVPWSVFSFISDKNAFRTGFIDIPSMWNKAAIGESSIGLGHNTTASGWGSHAQGYLSQATGWVANAQGYATKSTNYASSAEGWSTEANGRSSHAEGESTKANGDYSHAEGYLSQANGRSSHAQGEYTSVNGQFSFVGGYYATSTANNTFTWAIANSSNPYLNNVMNSFHVSVSNEIKLISSNIKLMGSLLLNDSLITSVSGTYNGITSSRLLTFGETTKANIYRFNSRDDTNSYLEIYPGYKGTTAQNGVVTYNIPNTGTHFFSDNVEVDATLITKTIKNESSSTALIINSIRKVLSIHHNGVDVARFIDASLLPTSGAGGGVYHVTGYGSPYTGKLVFGDGSGWRYCFTSKSGGAGEKDVFTVIDNGIIRLDGDGRGQIDNARYINGYITDNINYNASAGYGHLFKIGNVNQLHIKHQNIDFLNNNIINPAQITSSNSIYIRSKGGSPFLLDGAILRPLNDSSCTIGDSGFAYWRVYAYGFPVSSDRNRKSNIQPLECGLNFINRLEPVSYNYNEDMNETRRYGFIAQDVEKAMCNERLNVGLIEKDNNGKNLSLNYIDLIAPMVKAIQQLTARVEELENQLSRYNNFFM